MTQELGLCDSSSRPRSTRRTGRAANRFAGRASPRASKILGRIKKKFGVPVLTDIHDIAQVAPAAKTIDVLQIPAFLCRQTDLLVAAAKSGRAVNVKKGQFLAPDDVEQHCRQADSARPARSEYYITERGTTFGYHNLVVDMRGLAQMRAAGHRVIFDATHSVQQPGGRGTSTGGDRSMAPVLARAAVAAGVDGLFHRNASAAGRLALRRREHDSPCADGGPAANVTSH